MFLSSLCFNSFQSLGVKMLEKSKISHLNNKLLGPKTISHVVKAVKTKDKIIVIK